MEIYLFVYVNHIFYIHCIYYWYPREYNTVEPRYKEVGYNKTLL